jgi:NAD(P)-dependent dehydrogenase (short-subunit alcohol dehydrogenase family)
MSLRILLTGASRGLGRAMLEGFAALGHTVCGCSTNAKFVAELRQLFPEPHRFECVDVRDDRPVATWAKLLNASTEPFDLILNNAAIVNECRPLWAVPADEFQKVMDVNVVGTANVIRHFVPGMVKRGKGVIVNFSSGWGRSTSPEVAPYCASKYAVEGLTLALAQELPDGMAAIPLNPGIINTEMLQTCFGDEAASYPTPAKWAQVAVPYVLSLGPKHNGQSLSVPI